MADENVYEPIIAHLRNLGHDVLSIRESGLSGSADEAVYNLARDDKRIVITMDKDFSSIFRFPPENCGGIIVVKIYRRTLGETLELFKKMFDSIKETDIIENLIIMTPDGYRIKRSKR